MSIGTNIKKRRFELNMSQQELANALGYKARSTIAKIEADENAISTKKLVEFAKVLDTTTEYLVSGTSTNIINILNNKNDNEYIVVILAGGKSTRNQKNIPNQFISVLGKPIIIYSMEAYQQHPAISSIYVVCLHGWEDIVRSYCAQYNITKLKEIITGGETGILSIKKCIDYFKLNKINPKYIIFQESTRPLISEELISKLIWNVKEKGSAVTCESMIDHLQFLKSDFSYKYINRNLLIDSQSPDAYKYEILQNAFNVADKNKHNYQETCCTSFMNNISYALNFFEGNHNNIKIIRQEDIAVFSTLIRVRNLNSF